jgi:hypothetical protein
LTDHQMVLHGKPMIDGACSYQDCGARAQ